MTTNIRFQLTEDDYIAAQRLYRPKSWLRQLISPLSAAGLVLAFALLWRSHPPNWQVLCGAAIAGVVGYYIVQLAFNYSWMPWKARRIFRQQRTLDLPADLSWDEHGLHTRNDNGQYKYPWTDFLRWREDKKLFVLNLSDVMFLMVPKRAFPDLKTEDTFRELVRTRIGQSKSVSG